MYGKIPLYVAIRYSGPVGVGELIRTFHSATDMDNYSRACEDEDVYIYRLGTDFLTDGHTEGTRR
jgi:hypothetical protein